MRSHAMLTLIVAATVAAGMVAFLLAAPGTAGRLTASERGFRMLDEAVIDARMAHAARYHRREQAQLEAERAARLQSRAWLDALAAKPAGSARPRPALVRVAGVDAAATRRAAALVRWADGIDAAAWRVTITRVAPLALEDRALADRAAFVAYATIDVTVAHARLRTRRERVGVELELLAAQPVRAGRAPTAWQVRDLRITSGPGPGVRAYADPVVMRGARVDVVAPAARRGLAVEVSRDSQRQLARLLDRYPSLSPATSTTIWILTSGDEAPSVLGRSVPDATRVAGRDELHHAAWTNAAGDVTVDGTRFARLAPDQRRAAIRHELVHVALLDAADSLPALLLEGIAIDESRVGTAASAGAPRPELEPLVEAFSTATSGIARGLVARSGGVLVGDLDRLAAAATVDWIEQSRGHAALVELLAQLDDGTDPRVALRRTLGLEPRGIERLVATWTREQAAGDAGEVDRKEENTP